MFERLREYLSNKLVILAPKILAKGDRRDRLVRSTITYLQREKEIYRDQGGFDPGFDNRRADELTVKDMADILYSRVGAVAIVFKGTDIKKSTVYSFRGDPLIIMSCLRDGYDISAHIVNQEQQRKRRQ